MGEVLSRHSLIGFCRDLDDPALFDVELRRKLDSHQKQSKKNMNDVSCCNETDWLNFWRGHLFQTVVINPHQSGMSAKISVPFMQILIKYTHMSRQMSQTAEEEEEEQMEEDEDEKEEEIIILEEKQLLSQISNGKRAEEFAWHHCKPIDKHFLNPHVNLQNDDLHNAVEIFSSAVDVEVEEEETAKQGAIRKVSLEKVRAEAQSRLCAALDSSVCVESSDEGREIEIEQAQPSLPKTKDSTVKEDKLTDVPTTEPSIKDMLMELACTQQDGESENLEGEVFVLLWHWNCKGGEGCRVVVGEVVFPTGLQTWVLCGSNVHILGHYFRKSAANVVSVCTDLFCRPNHSCFAM